MGDPTPHPHPLQATETMKMLCYELMDPAKAGPFIMDIVILHADRLVQLLTDRTHAVFTEASNAVGPHNAPLQSSTRACKYCLNTLMNSFANPVIAAQVRLARPGWGRG